MVISFGVGFSFLFFAFCFPIWKARRRQENAASLKALFAQLCLPLTVEGNGLRACLPTWKVMEGNGRQTQHIHIDLNGLQSMVML